MVPTLIVDNRVRVPVVGLPEDLVERLKEVCTHKNPDYAKALRRARGRYTPNMPATIPTWRHEQDHLTLPSGAMGRVRRAFGDHAVAFKVVDARSEGMVVSARRPLKYLVGEGRGHVLRGSQIAMIEKAFAKERCVVRAATGSGKTHAALALAAKIGLNTLVILPNAKLLRQWQKLAIKVFDLKPDQVGIIRGAKRRLRPITVATQQTLWSRDIDDELKEFFGAVIVDEGHHAAATTFMRTIDQFPARYRIAFTADERRKDKKQFIIYDLIGDVAHEVSRDQCEAEGAIVDVEIRVVMTNFSFPDYHRDRDFNTMLSAMTEDEKRNTLAVNLALSKIREGKQIIMLTHRREHARDIDRALIARGIVSGCLLGAQEAGDVEEFEDMCEKLVTGTAQAGVGTYQALGEGIDLPAVSAGIAMTPISANKQLFNQVRGRLCRISPTTGKSIGCLYVLYDPHVLSSRDLKNIVAWNRTVFVQIEDGSWVTGKQFLKRGR